MRLAISTSWWMQSESTSIHKVKVRLRHCYFLKGGFAHIGGDRLITVILGARFSGVGIHKVLNRSGPCLWTSR